MAYSALKEQYDFLCNDELLKLVPVASQDLPKEVNAVSVMLREPGAEAWKILIGKMNLAFHRHQISLATLKAAGFRFLQHGWRIIEDPVELADYSKNGKSAAMILQELQDTYQSRKAAVHHLVRGAEVLPGEHEETV
jgi:hypothetical protein